MNLGMEEVEGYESCALTHHKIHDPTRVEDSSSSLETVDLGMRLRNTSESKVLPSPTES